jgi:hypothetical protein
MLYAGVISARLVAPLRWACMRVFDKFAPDSPLDSLERTRLWKPRFLM